MNYYDLQKRIIANEARTRNLCEIIARSNPRETLIQKVIDSVDSRGFYDYECELADQKQLAQLMKFFEESGELAGAIYDNDIHAVASELADVFVTVCSLAHVFNVNLEQEVLDKLRSDEKRGHLHAEELPFTESYNGYVSRPLV